MPIWYNVATRKKSGRVGSLALLYGLCIVHSPNFLWVNTPTRNLRALERLTTSRLTGNL